MAPSARVTTRDKAADLANDAGARFLHLTERFLLRSSLVPTTPFLPTDTFEWIAGLEAGWPVIRAELDEVLGYRDDLPNFQDISVDQASITDDDGWKTFFFFGYGFRSEANCARCPKTAAILGQIPGLTTAFFSILSPHKEIGAHRGPWRGVLRYHLALKVPEPVGSAGISVGGQVAQLGGRVGASCSTTATSTRPGTTPTESGWSSSSTSSGPCGRPADQLNRALIGPSVAPVHPRRPPPAWARSRGAEAFESLRTGGWPVTGKPDADLFAKVGRPPLDEYRYVAESLDLIPFYREIEGEIGPTSRFQRSAGRDARIQQLSRPHHRPPGRQAPPTRPSTATVRGSRAAVCSMARCPCTPSSRSSWPTGWAWRPLWCSRPGYAANLGLIGALVGPGDAAVVDSAAHASLVDGARYSEGTLRAFRHNRPNSLRRTLRSWREQAGRRWGAGRGGRYLLHGRATGRLWPRSPPTARRFGARLLVDEAHALGVVGPRGAGTAPRPGGPAGPGDGYVLQVAWPAVAVSSPGRSAVVKFLKMTLPPAHVHRLRGARRRWPAPWRRPGSPGPRIGAGSPCGPGRPASPGPGRPRLSTSVPRRESAIVPVHVGDNWEAGPPLEGSPGATASTPTVPFPPLSPGPCCAPRSWRPTPRRTSTGPWRAFARARG